MKSGQTAEQALDLLKEISKIHSASSHVSGVEKLQKLWAARLKKIGFQIRWIPHPKKQSAKLLDAFLPGESKSEIIFVSHSDTVDGFASSFSLKGAGRNQRAVGQGLLDDKASQVVLVNGLEHFLARTKKPKFGLRFLSSPNEEKGSEGFHEHYRQASKRAVLALGFEPALEGGDIINARKGNRWYDLQITGHESHAGRAPGAGVNAALDLAIKIQKIVRLARPARGTTISVGSVRSQRDVYNVVCGWAAARFDVRFSTFEERDRVHAALQKIALTSFVRSKDGKVSQSRLVIDDDCPPFAPIKGSSAKFAKIYLASLRAHAGALQAAQASGGAADVCYLSRPGLPVLDGLGACGGGMHSDHEWVDLSSLEPRILALSDFLVKISSSAMPKNPLK